MSNIRLFLLCLTALLHFQCSKKMHTVNASNEITSPPVLPASNLSLKLNVSRAELNRSLDYLVNSSFSEGFTIEDGYRILTKISGPIDMQTSNNALVTRLPLQVDITPPGIFHNLKVKGQIEITLTTQIDIFQDQLLNKTELSQHKWISKPVVSVLGLNIPIEQIGNFAIRKYKTIICQSIDESISANVDLKKLKQVSQKYFVKPLYSTEDSIIHLFASPQEMALGPMSMTPEDLVLPLTIYFESVIAELRPLELNQDPSISIRPYFDNLSTFQIQSRIPLPYIEQLVRENVEHQQFGSGMTSVLVKKIRMKGAASTFFIEMDLSGAYNGTMELQFDPAYNLADKRVELKNLKLKSIRGKKMEKVIFSIVKGLAESKIRKTIEDQINGNLVAFVEQTNQLLQGTEWLDGIKLYGDLKHYEIRNIRFYDSRLYFTIVSELQIEAQVKKINTERLVYKKS